MGHCNDAFSAIRVASAPAGAFGVGVNDLPLSLVISWYGQEAVPVLLTLLHLGIRNVRLGPKLPAFVTPAVPQVLVEKFATRPIGTVEEACAASPRKGDRGKAVMTPTGERQDVADPSSFLACFRPSAGATGDRHLARRGAPALR